MTNILLTGGSGFIGSHLTERLLELGHQVTNFDQNPPDNVAYSSYWTEGNVENKGQLLALLEESQPEIVIHLAARAEISSTQWEDYSSIHLGTESLLDALEGVKSVTRLVNISTQLVVGPGSFPKSDEDYVPYTTYGEAKAYAERLLRDRDPDYEWTTLRPTNIWGPRHPSFSNSIWRYLQKRYYLHPQTRDPVIRCYGYVKNTVDQIVSIANASAQDVDRKVFYLADGAIDSSRWLDEFSLQLSGHKARRIPLGLLRVLAAGGDLLKSTGLRVPIESGRVMRMTTDYPVPLENLNNLVSGRQISLEEGVSQTVQWLKTTFPTVYARG